MKIIPLEEICKGARTDKERVRNICKWRNESLNGWSSDHFEVYRRTKSGTLYCCHPDAPPFDDGSRIFKSEFTAIWADIYIFDFLQTSFEAGVWVSRDGNNIPLLSTSVSAETFEFWSGLSLGVATEHTSFGLNPEATEAGIAN